MNLIIKEVARRAKVTTRTVYRVINDKSLVNEKTRKRISAILDQYEYQPNLIARSLKKKKTNIVGITIPDISNQAFTEMVKGCMDELNDKGYYVLLGSYENDSKKEIGFIKDFNLLMIVGAIMIPFFQENDSITTFNKIKYPVVFLDREINGLKKDMVIANNNNGAYKATKYLLDQGLKNIIFLGSFQALKVAQRRYEGWKKAMNEKKLFNKDLVFWRNSSSITGYDIMNQAFKKHKKIDAVFAINDLIARGAIDAIKDKGLKIPKDISIIGFDNTSISKLLNPSLSTVDSQLYNQGKIAAQLLLDRITNPTSSPKRIVLDCNLILRESTI